MPGPSYEPPMGLPDDTQTISSQSSQSSNEQEVSIRVDEMEDQQQKRKSLNEAVGSISSGQFSPVLCTLNTSWGDISNTQQRYYIRKATEAISTTLSVISPGQENEIWSVLRQAPILLENQNPVESSKRKFSIRSLGLSMHWLKHITRLNRGTLRDRFCRSLQTILVVPSFSK